MKEFIGMMSLGCPRKNSQLYLQYLTWRSLMKYFQNVNWELLDVYQQLKHYIMDLIIEQSKEYFIGRDYSRALKIIQNDKQQIAKDKLPIAYDLAGCCCFMMKNYDAAINYFDQAIALAPGITDFYISKGAALRSLKREDQALSILEEAEEKVTDPAIYYNLKWLAKNEEEIEAQTILISKYEDLNKNYSKWEGIVPSFLKSETSRSDYVYKCQEEVVEEILASIDNQADYSTNLKKVQNSIQLLQVQFNNHGFKFSGIVKILLPTYKRMIKAYGDINQKVKLEVEQKQLMDKFVEIMKLIKQNPKEAEEIGNSLVTNLQAEVNIKMEKEIQLFRVKQNYDTAKKDALCEKVFNLTEIDEPSIQIAVTQNNFLIYIQPEFIRFLTPQKSLRELKKLPLSIGEELFNLFWFACLRVILGSEQGIGLNKYIKFWKAFNLIYSQIEGADQLKRDEESLPYETIYIIQKYNEISDLNFLAKEKKQKIKSNCQAFKNYLFEIDLMFQSFLANQSYIKVLTQGSKNQQSIKQQVFFRQHYKLDPTKFEDRIVQNLIIIFYHFRNPCKSHDLLVKAFVQMTVETKDTLSGKESFYKNFYDSHQPQPTFIQKIWKKISE